MNKLLIIGSKHYKAIKGRSLTKSERQLLKQSIEARIRFGYVVDASTVKHLAALL